MLGFFRTFVWAICSPAGLVVQITSGLAKNVFKFVFEAGVRHDPDHLLASWPCRWYRSHGPGKSVRRLVFQAVMVAHGQAQHGVLGNKRSSPLWVLCPMTLHTKAAIQSVAIVKNIDGFHPAEDAGRSSGSNTTASKVAS
jgi:hypothetical protein